MIRVEDLVKRYKKADQTNLAIIAVAFVAFMVIGTAGFVRAERNR